VYYNTRMVLTGLRRASGIGLALAGLAVLLWGTWPAAQAKQLFPYAYGKELALPAGWDSLQPPPSLANGVFTLHWPTRVRLGDEGVISLEFSGADPQTPCPQAENDPAFILTSRLELPGVPVMPANELSQPIVSCRPAFQAWTVRPDEIGRVFGTAWLHLSVDGMGKEFQPELAIGAVPVDIPVTGLFGLSGGQARLVGVLAILSGLALNIDLLIRRA